MNTSSASTGIDGMPADRQQKPLRRRKNVSFAATNDVMTFEVDISIAAQSTERFQVGLGTEPGDDVEMRDASLDDNDYGGLVPSAFSTWNMSTQQQPIWFSGLHPTQPPSHGAAHWQVQPAAQAQLFQPLPWSQPIEQQQAPRPQDIMGTTWDTDQQPEAIDPVPDSRPLFASFPTPFPEPPHRARSGDPEINRALDKRDGQVRDLLEWLLDEARLDKPPRHFHQILHVVAQELEQQHYIDANIVRKMILRHREPNSQSHRDLFHLLESYLLEALDPAFFKDLVLLLEEFCRHER